MNHLRTAAVAVGLTLGVLGLGQRLLKPRAPVPAPVQPAYILTDVSAADAAEYRKFFAAVAEQVERDGRSQDPVCRTTFDLRNRYRHALKLAFENTPLAGKYPGLGAKLDAYMLQAIGGVDNPLTTDERAKTAAALRAIR